MDAAGRDYVIIETVGVGQDEIEITSVAQVTVVVLVPGMGDDVYGYRLLQQGNQGKAKTP